MILSEISQFQPKAFSSLARSMHADRIAGTYLFHDPGGRGDWYLAIALAALLNCEQPEQTDQPDFPIMPCGSCRVCHQIVSLNFEGFHFALPIS
ncbi:MAG: hypothetical protein KAU36_07415, partial [candidate division Zixibacteria bacterium]|nr:hypothetical protein [candidate division Zixibacteria bacterium]